MKKEIVLPRYKEDISWADDLENVTIYNKGPRIESKHNVINLPNLGMYGASQLYHCYKNYDKLADITIFLQAWPWDGTLEEQMGWQNNEQGIQNMLDYYSNIPTDKYMSIAPIQQTIGNNYNCPTNYNQRHHDYFITWTHTWLEWIKLLDPFGKINHFEPWAMYRNGHCALRKEAILSNPKEYYEMLLDHWKYDVPVVEWFTESSIQFIYNIDINCNLIDLGHSSFDFSNNKNFSDWLYEIP
jgi:hypothetical protein